MTGKGKSETAFGGRKVLFLVENLSVPFDPRVWQECRSLRRAGFDVTVVCPAGNGHDTEAYEERDGVKIHRFSPRPSTGGALSYLREYVIAMWQMQKLIRGLSRRQRFDIVHACNPPDLLLLPAVRLRKRQRTCLVFDQHDLAPELYLSRFGRGRDSIYRILLAFERLSFRLADVVIATNESYRDIALTRGRKRPEDVFVVRNSPDLRAFAPAQPNHALKRGKTHLIAYVGMMGPQDGVDVALRALASLVTRRSDWHALFVGDGDVLPAMQRLADELGLTGSVEFAGLMQRRQVVEVLTTADVCISPEPMNPLNDKSTMMKVAEYMAHGRPLVAFDLHETRATAADAASYARPNDEESFARRIDELLSNPQLRTTLGERGRDRIESELSWAHSELQLFAAYSRAIDGMETSDPLSPAATEAVIA